MPEYRLYRLHVDDSVFDRVDYIGPDDAAAIAEAIRIDHAEYVEIWNGVRKVTRVAPGRTQAQFG